jgi:hypothetical protein
LAAVTERPDMALFAGRMARISCIAMGREVWFERHESIVVGRSFCAMTRGRDRAVVDLGGILQGAGARFSSSAGFGQVFWQASPLADLLGSTDDMTMSKARIGRRLAGLAVLAAVTMTAGAALAATLGQPTDWNLNLQESASIFTGFTASCSS